MELEEQVSNLSRDKRELEEKVEELTPHRMLKATLNSNKCAIDFRKVWWRVAGHA